MSFEIIYTEKGLEKLIDAEAGTPLVFVNFAIGDGQAEPMPTQEALQNEKWRGAINKAEKSDTDATKLLIKCVVPSDSGISEEFYIRELGLFDNTDTLIAIAKVPDRFYSSTQNGISSEAMYSLTLAVSNDAEIQLTLNSSLLATQISVEELNEEVDDLASSLEAVDKKLTDLTNTLVDTKQKFQNSLTAQIGKVIINLCPLHKDKTLWNDGIFEYALCNGQSINATTYPKLAEIYGSNVPNFQGTLRHLEEGDSRALGSFQDFSIENIVGQIGATDYIFNETNTTGVFNVTASSRNDRRLKVESDTITTWIHVNFDASRVVKTSTETRMANTAVQIFVIARLINT